MAENTIEIEVELKGQENVTKHLDALKDGAKDVGEGFKGVTSVMDKSSSQIGEGLATMSDAVGSSIEAIGGLKDSVNALGSGGSASMLSLLGPIGLVTTAISALYEGYRQLSGAAAAAEARQEAMAAASADLTSKLEALAEGGVIPTTNALLQFSTITLQSQVAKELLQGAVEKTKPAMERYQESVEALNKAQAEMNRLEGKGLKLTDEGLAARRRLNAAQAAVAKTQGAYMQQLKKLEGPLRANLEALSEAAKQEKKLEENTTDNLKAKVKEQAERLKALQIADQEVYTKDQLVLLNAKEQISLEAANVARKSEDMSREELIKTIDQQQQAINRLTKADVEHLAQSARSRRAFADAEAKQREAEDKKREQEAKARRAKQQAQATQELMLQSRLNQLNIKLTKEGDDERLALARERHQTGLQLAKDNVTARAIVEKQYQLETQQIMDQAFQRELANMDKLDKERELRRQKRIDAENRAMRKQAREQEKMLKMVGDVIDFYGKGLARAGVNTLLFGESFKKAAGEVLKGLAVESGVRALMMAADGLAKLFINPADAAASFKSAALYTAAAGAARAGAGALGAGGGGGGATASPTGAPQVATAPQRETAETQATTININFGGAVVYDTREAARRAMMNELVRTYNGNPRSVQRFSMR